MANPSHTARGAGPSGIKLKDGHSCVLRFAAAPTVGLWFKSPTPPGLDGGDPIPQTTMENNLWRTFALRQLLTLTPVTGKAAYDPKVLSDLQSIINVEGSCTFHFSDGSYVDFFGGLTQVTFDAVQEGQQPECTVTWVPTNVDGSGNEVGPVYVDAPGT